MAADVVPIKKSCQKMGLKRALELEVFGNIAVQHVFKFFPSEMEVPISFIQKPFQLRIIADRKELVDIDFFSHIQLARHSYNSFLQVLNHGNHFDLIFSKNFVSLGLKPDGIDTILGIAFESNCMA